MLGISTLSIQTAGYYGQVVPEIRIDGIEHADDLRELIRSLVRESGVQDYGTGFASSFTVSADQKMIDELVKIRMLLEQPKKKI
jgi:hypothetical protein